jgi:hypothetical protein
MLARIRQIHKANYECHGAAADVAGAAARRRNAGRDRAAGLMSRAGYPRRESTGKPRRTGTAPVALPATGPVLGPSAQVRSSVADGLSK